MECQISNWEQNCQIKNLLIIFSDKSPIPQIQQIIYREQKSVYVPIVMLSSKPIESEGGYQS